MHNITVGTLQARRCSLELFKLKSMWQKFIQINSIRNRMISGFLFLTVLILVISAVSLYLLDHTVRIADMHGSISKLQIYTLSLFKNDNDFYDLETINPQYFENHSSSFLVTRDSLKDEINNGLFLVRRQSMGKVHEIDKNFHRIDSALKIYNEKFERLEKLLFAKGFKDFGIEGKMRFHAHILEGPHQRLATPFLLTLRRHEKDFLLRLDPKYIESFNNLVVVIISGLDKNSLQDARIIYHVKEYQKYFIKLTEIHKQIGLSSLQGLRYELNTLTFEIGKEYLMLSRYSFTRSMLAQNNAKIWFAVLIIAAISFSLLSGFWISRRLSEPIANLSRIMKNVTEKRQRGIIEFKVKNAANEINTLMSSFQILMEQMRIQLKENKLKSKLLKKRNKELKKLNKELDNFLYSTAHDLRSPLTSLLGLLNLIKYENKQEVLDPYFDLMKNSIHRMESFISQIVNYAKNKRIGIHYEKVDLPELINEIFENHRFVEGSEKILKDIMIMNDHLPFVSDRSRLLIIFNNLISNGIRYADFRKTLSFIKIQITISDEEITIYFSDNGIGISEDHLPKIFDMFYRADLTSKGSGLGLYILKESIASLDGKVNVNSKVFEGTRFEIHLPNNLAALKVNKVKSTLQTAILA